MSWNTMMEGFTRHEVATGQNPLKMAEEQNRQIKEQVEVQVAAAKKKELEAKVEELRRRNEEADARLEKQRREILEKERFYRENAPPQVRAQLGRIFRGEVEEEEGRFEEIAD